MIKRLVRGLGHKGLPTIPDHDGLVELVHLGLQNGIIDGLVDEGLDLLVGYLRLMCARYVQVRGDLLVAQLALGLCGREIAEQEHGQLLAQSSMGQALLLHVICVVGSPVLVLCESFVDEHLNEGVQLGLSLRWDWGGTFCSVV